MFAYQQLNGFSNMSYIPFWKGQTANSNNAALCELEDEQKWSTGPQWHIEKVVLKI